jgi:hypothetical protein
MAEAILGGNTLARKPSRRSFNTSRAVSALTLPGLVQHPLVSPDDQVRILDAIKQSGTASLEEIIAALPGHPAPASAALALVQAGILQISEGLIDGDIQLTRPGYAPLSQEDIPVEEPIQTDAATPSMSMAMVRIEPDDRQPLIYAIAGERRAALKHETALQRPGVYIGIRGRDVYVGMGEQVGVRVGKSVRLATPTAVDRLICVVDRMNSLTVRDARVLERLMVQALQHDGHLRIEQTLPDGDDISPEGYDLLRLFALQACLALRQSGELFFKLPSAALFLPPAAPQAYRPVAQDARLFTMNALGLKAHLADERGEWRLLPGSEVRPDVLPNAHASARMKRAELLHSGGLRRTGEVLTLTQEMRFGSASSASHFVTGGKSRVDLWKPAKHPGDASGPRV